MAPHSDPQAIFDKLLTLNRDLVATKKLLRTMDPEQLYPILLAQLSGRGGFDGRTAVLDFFPILPFEAQRQLFPKLVEACLTEKNVKKREYELITAMPRDWVLANIEAVTEPYVAGEHIVEYHLVHSLYRRLDPGLTKRFVERAKQSENSDIREFGCDHDEAGT
jgi:hypothetical protein